MGVFERILKCADPVGQNCDFVMEHFGIGEHKPDRNWHQRTPVAAELTICAQGGQYYLLPLPVVRDPVGC